MTATMIGSQERVHASTEQSVNERIRRQTEANIAYYASRLDQIETRLAELEREWDIERVLQTNAAVAALTGLTLGMVWRKWLVLPIAVAGFLLQHATRGWCPPLPMFRRLGVRTCEEINQERYALKALRGDFAGVDGHSEEDPLTKANKAMEAAEPVSVSGSHSLRL